MGSSRFSPCPSCCGCAYFEDDFNRPDSGVVGAPWLELAGDSDIYSNTLRLPTAGKVLLDRALPQARLPDPPYTLGMAYQLDFDLIDPQNGQNLRIWLAVEWDPATDTLIQYGNRAIDINVDDTGLITGLFLRDDLSEPLKTTDCKAVDWPAKRTCTGAGAELRVVICLAITHMSMRFEEDHYLWWPRTFGPARDATTGHEARIVFQNNGDVPLRLDNVTIQRHYLWNPTCPYCICLCRGRAYPRTLHATWQNVQNCPRIDGWTTTLHNHQAGACITGGDHCHIWRPDYILGPPPLCTGRPYCEHKDDPSNRNYVDLVFECSGSATEPASTLTFGSPAPCTSLPALTLIDWDCDPLTLTFEADWYDSAEGCYEGSPYFMFATGSEGTYPDCPSIHRILRIVITE